MSDRLDVVLYGATGFTGKQTASYFADHAPPDLRWAIAGRNRDKLDQVADSCRPHDVIVADSSDPESVDDMCSQTRVLLTTAGPFSKYGTPVVESCVRHKTDYVDITGETPWVRDLIDQFHEQAAADGTRIVPFCGFDSIPSDLGALLVVDHFRQQGLTTRSVSASFTASGGLNGGTLDSAVTMAEDDRMADVADVLLLNPPNHRTAAERQRSADRRSVDYDDTRQVWLMPFMMAPINTRVVRRSNALADDYGEGYGDEFSYHEAMETKRRLTAYAVTGAMAAFQQVVQRSWGRTMLKRYGPAPGQGPSDKKMDHGFFRTRLVGEADDGSRAMVTLSYDGDPGNRSTVLMLCESALLLATARDQLPGAPDRGGILTPATALGLPLVDRLRAAGMSIDVEPL